MSPCFSAPHCWVLSRCEGFENNTCGNVYDNYSLPKEMVKGNRTVIMNRANLYELALTPVWAPLWLAAGISFSLCLGFGVFTVWGRLTTALMKEFGGMESWGLIRGARSSCVLLGGNCCRTKLWNNKPDQSIFRNSIQVQSTGRGLSEQSL